MENTPPHTHRETQHLRVHHIQRKHGNAQMMQLDANAGLTCSQQQDVPLTA